MGPSYRFSLRANISSIAATLKNNSLLTGKLTNVSLSLDAGSVWTVTGNSVLGSLVDTSGISGTSITNIKGNGYTVTYNPNLSANSYLGGKTYSLASGGTLAPSTSATSSVPAIASGGVVNAASGVSGVAPGAWISIFGTNLSIATASAASSDLVNGYLPTTLGGTTVTIDGKPAYLNYVSPTQLNLQAPDDAATGTVTVTVTTSAGSGSATATMQAVMPGLFTSSNNVLAVRPSDGAILTGTAAAGDILEVFATGMGATSAGIAPGLVFSGAYSCSSTPSVTIGTAAATVSYCGLVGAGLYQINLAVPAGLSAGTYPVIVTQNGLSSPSTAVLKVTAN